MQPFPFAISKYLLAPLIACLTAFIPPQPSLAQSISAVDRGLAVVDEWCRSCHVRTQAKKSPDTAPLFQEITRRPGRNKAYLRAFMDEDHFPMTTFRLFDAEKDDVVEYLISLKRQ